jgi:hypothetical protein
MYFRSWGLITDDQLILGLGIRPEVCPGDNVDLEGAAEDVTDARGDQLLELQNPEQSSTSSLVDTEATHTDPGSGDHRDPLGLDLYNEDNPSEYGPSP